MRTSPDDLVLGVLDQSPIPSGSTAPDALRNTLELARAADRLGYARYWVAQHDEFSRQLEELIALLSDHRAETRIRAIPDPGPGRMPELWLLGSSDYGALCAAQFGTAFSFAHFINPGLGPAVARAYRDRFRPSPRLAAPRVGVGVGVICADDEAEARRLAQSVGLWRLRLERGDPGPVPSVEEAESHPYSDAERARLSHSSRRLVVGAPEQVRAALLAVASEYRADELALLTLVHDPAARLRSYELVAEAFALSGAPTARR